MEAHSGAEQEPEQADLLDGRHAGDDHVHRDQEHTAHRQNAAEEEDEVHHRFQPLSRGSGERNLFVVHSIIAFRNSLIHRNSTGSADQVSSIGTGGKVEESLCLLRQGDRLVGDEHEGALHLVAAVLDGLLAALHTVQR